MYEYNGEFVLEAMVMITSVSFDERPTDGYGEVGGLEKQLQEL